MIDRPNDLGNLIAYYVPPLAEMQMSKKEYHPYANWVRVLRPVERDSVYVQEYRLRPFDLYVQYGYQVEETAQRLDLFY